MTRAELLIVAVLVVGTILSILSTWARIDHRQRELDAAFERGRIEGVRQTLNRIGPGNNKSLWRFWE